MTRRKAHRIDRRKLSAYVTFVIRTFKSKALSELWSKGRSAKIAAKMHKRIFARLYRLDVAIRPEEMNVPGFDFHPLHSFDPTRYSVHVNGPWCITLEFEDGEACRVDFEQYH
jgi:proteic killer suppression protein